MTDRFHPPCNAYCAGDSHCSLVWLNRYAVKLGIGPGEAAALAFGDGPRRKIRVERVEPAREPGKRPPVAESVDIPVLVWWRDEDHGGERHHEIVGSVVAS